MDVSDTENKVTIKTTPVTRKKLLDLATACIQQYKRSADRKIEGSC